MNEPTVTCRECGNQEVCKVSGISDAVSSAKKRLAKRCLANGHKSNPVYRVGGL